MKRIGVIFGGRSQEHEISVLSASAVAAALDLAGYETVPIAINKQGSWFLIEGDITGITSLDDSRFATLIPDGDSEGEISAGNLRDYVDFAFPILHGPYGEDGTVQGLFEMIDIPYAGCGVASSAISMDKIFSKELLIAAGLPVCRHDAAYAAAFCAHPDSELSRIENNMPYPVFVKPANMGSSVGVSRATDRESLHAAILHALEFDNRVIIEEEMRGRELEVAVLGNNEPETGAVGEIVTDTGFYDYDTKYRGSGVTLDIPAKLPEGKRTEIEELAKRTFSALGGTGFSRIDFFMDGDSGRLYVNEMNSIPGFTNYSMFPRLWKAKGVEFPQLVERIVKLGYERYNAKNSRQSR